MIFILKKHQKCFDIFWQTACPKKEQLNLPQFDYSILYVQWSFAFKTFQNILVHPKNTNGQSFLKIFFWILPIEAFASWQSAKCSVTFADTAVSTYISPSKPIFDYRLMPNVLYHNRTSSKNTWMRLNGINHKIDKPRAVFYTYTHGDRGNFS